MQITTTIHTDEHNIHVTVNDKTIELQVLEVDNITVSNKAYLNKQEVQGLINILQEKVNQL